GVLDHWNPQPRFYDVVNSGGFATDADDVFLPFQTAIQANIPNDGNTNCNAVPKESGFVGLQHSACAWIAFMAECCKPTKPDSLGTALQLVLPSFGILAWIAVWNGRNTSSASVANPPLLTTS